jgi:hypothetical protein
VKQRWTTAKKKEVKAQRADGDRPRQRAAV